MPIEATLTCLREGKLVELLKQCPSLASGLLSANDCDAFVRVDVLHLLMVEDLTGRKYTASSADVAVWEGAATEPILSEENLGPLEYTNYVGTWNAKFLSWVKATSRAAGEKVEIDYLHERGDYPHEYAWWSSDPTSPEGAVEAFGIESQDSDPQWRREVLRHVDGRLEVHVNDWPSALPGDA